MSKERAQAVIRSIYLLSGGALAVSLAIFLRSESLELGADLVVALQASWALLFYSLAAAALAEFLGVSDERPRAARFFLRTGLAGLVAGLALLAYVSAVALADSNAEDEDDQQAVHASATAPSAFLVELPNAAGSRPDPGSGALAPRRERGA